MNIEIEAKIKLDSHEPVIEKLESLNDAKFDREIEQTDTFFMDENNTLLKNDCGLRLRRETSASNETIILTFKGPKQKGLIKSRTEIETAVSDFENTAIILESLGYKRRLTFKKIRKIWHFQGCEVCLDFVPQLGYFLEVEGPGEEIICDVLGKLGYRNFQHVTDSYAKMVSKYLEQQEL